MECHVVCLYREPERGCLVLKTSPVRPGGRGLGVWLTLIGFLRSVSGGESQVAPAEDGVGGGEGGGGGRSGEESSGGGQ